MRNTHLKDIRSEWAHSKFYFGNNRVIAKALGVTAEEEYKEGASLLTQDLKGNGVGLLFTNQPKEEVKAYCL